MMTKRIALSLLATGSLCFAQIYNESGGLVVMEMESTSSPLGQWQQQNSLSGYTGDGYLRFLGNTFETGPADSPLEFQFQINRAGLYYLHIRCAKETHDGRTDVANDCYVRVEGDYTAGPGPHDSHGNNASLSLLQNDTKYFGGAANSWKWENGQNSSGGNGNLDPGGHSNKRVAVYAFKAGETYKLVLSGRSKFFRVDRIVFCHSDTSTSMAQNLITPVSQVVSSEVSYLYDTRADFPDITSGDIEYYRDNGNGALAIAANIVSNRTGFAKAERVFDGASGVYDVAITTMTEEDGESTYRLLVNGVQVADYTNPFVLDPPDSPLDLQPHTHKWTGISIPSGATLAIESNADSNDQVSEAGDGNAPWAWARGRWQQIELSPSKSLIRPPVGRLAVVADGNSPDPDDIGAISVIFGILNRAGLNDRLVHLSHSCDLNPFLNPGSQSINPANELRRQNKLHVLCEEGVAFYGPFANLNDFYNCRTEQIAAVNDLRDAINASSAEDPLWIIEAGEPDVIGYALQEATASKHQFVHVVSHHPANDNSGDFFTWQQILDFGVTEHQIGDQNVGLQVLISSGSWDWAKGHPKPEITWILDQLNYAEQDGVVGFQSNKYDCSDAGMVYWWITGATSGGNRNSTPADIRNLLLRVSVDPDQPVAHWKLDEGAGVLAADSSGHGFNGTLLNGASWGSDATRSSYVSFDGTDDRITTLFAYALSSGDDFTWAWWANQQSTGTTDDGAIMLGNRYPQPGSGEDTYEFIKFTPTHGQFADANQVADIERYNFEPIAKGSWHHYAMVKRGTSYQWYVDGVAHGDPVTLNYDESSPLPFLIGGDDNGSGRVNEHFEGFIDDVVLYQKALDPIEVVNVRNGIYSDDNERTGLIQGLEEDADIRDDLTIVNLGADNLVPGRSGAGGGFSRATVFVFQLPDLGPVDNPFLSATLSFNVESVSASPPGVDLYGLGSRSAPTVLATDYYGENGIPDPTDADLIQNNILNGSTRTGLVESSASGFLKAYLNEQYAEGNRVGEYVFLRLSANGPITGLQRHFITSADSAAGNGPQISYTAIGPQDFENWIEGFNSPPGFDLSLGGDPDQDGLSTEYEYLFGLNPFDAGSVNPFASFPDPDTGMFRYTRRNPNLTGVTNYEIWCSENLSQWNHDIAAIQNLVTVGDVQEVEVTVSGSKPLPNSAMFFQVRINK